MDPDEEPAPAGAARPTAAALVIGDEILSGRTRDVNLHRLAGRLTERGVDLREARVVADDADAIEAAVRALSAGHDHVFTSGGIGPTHDDITADCVARAMGAALSVRDDARAILEAHYARQGTTINEARLRMARIPAGAALIENPVSGAPGFTIGNVHVMAGVPAIFEAMLESLLPRIAGGPPLVSETLRVERGEGDVAGPLGALAEARPDLAFGSYPFQGAQGRYGVNVVIRGTDPQAVRAARDELARALGLAGDRAERPRRRGGREPVTPPCAAALARAMEATWPPASTRRLGPALLREGLGGGGRVSAATMEAPWTQADIDAAEAAMERALWRVRAGEDALDAALAARGLALRDPTRLWWAEAARLAPERPERLTGFALWPPLAVMRDLWAEGGIGPARLAVMARAPAPRAGLLARVSDRPAGVAFAAVAEGIGVVHAIEVAPGLRRRGTAAALLRHAAWWARGHGARHLALAVTEANAPANALYARAGMTPAPGYHYRAEEAP